MNYKMYYYNSNLYLDFIQIIDPTDENNCSKRITSFENKNELINKDIYNDNNWINKHSLSEIQELAEFFECSICGDTSIAILFCIYHKLKRDNLICYNYIIQMVSYKNINIIKRYDNTHNNIEKILYKINKLINTYFCIGITLATRDKKIGLNHAFVIFKFNNKFYRYDSYAYKRYPKICEWNYKKNLKELLINDKQRDRKIIWDRIFDVSTNVDVDTTKKHGYEMELFYYKH
jgi:hypothetical protein